MSYGFTPLPPLWNGWTMSELRPQIGWPEGWQGRTIPYPTKCGGGIRVLPGPGRSALWCYLSRLREASVETEVQAVLREIHHSRVLDLRLTLGYGGWEPMLRREVDLG